MELVPDATSARPRRPAGFGAAGRKLWDDSWSLYELARYEIPTLVQACRLADTIDGLEKQVRRDGLMVVGSKGQQVLHPAVAEARQSRLAMTRLLGQIKFPQEDLPGGRAMSQSTRNKIKAGKARWAGRGATA